MKKLKAVIAKIDSNSRGKLQRWTIGKLSDEISGALYLQKDIELPCEVTIGFLSKNRKE